MVVKYFSKIIELDDTVKQNYHKTTVKVLVFRTRAAVPKLSFVRKRRQPKQRM